MKKFPNGTGVFFFYVDGSTMESSATYAQVDNAIRGGAYAVMVLCYQDGRRTHIPVSVVNTNQIRFNDYKIDADGVIYDN